ncbi:hypothetical protein SAMN06265348_10121 [Pedobacter westerhofensis]|uniref:Uncharacterized protein n=1 Tax=Pedobacter westerhofensis TaxID=425512 RepID=A0A521AB57_9SPHI|nr:hypothetical protein SAMN06265348_10121 [Pedobacter westerhofensis]
MLCKRPTVSLIGITQLFSKLLGSNAGTTYQSLLEGSKSWKDGKSFDSQFDSAKVNNENCVISVQDKSYLLSKTGWLLLQSRHDKISLDGRTVMVNSPRRKIRL